MPQFQVRVFEKRVGYSVVVDGIGHFDAKTLDEVRRLTRAFLRIHVSAAFPDRPPLDNDGAKLVLRYAIDLRELRS
jgi:hypothetical protein